MQNSSTEQAVSDMSRSHPLKSKKVCLIKLFKNNYRQSLSIPEFNVQNKDQNTAQNKPSESLKTQRLSVHHHNSTDKCRFSQMRVRTQTNQKVKKPVNIFQSDYAQCLKSGFINAYEQKSKLKNVVKQTNTFQGPVFYSQRSPKFEQNPQRNLQTVETKEQIYKCDRNPKLLKFKVSLKRNSFNATEQSKTIQSNKKQHSRVLLTQLKTQMSDQYPSQSHSHQVTRFIPQKRSFSIQQSGGFDPRNQNYKIPKKHSFQVPKLSQNTNTYHSIKIFQRKRMLLGQIESQKGIQQKYGKRILEFMLRDRHKQVANKNDFTINLKNDYRESKMIKNLKNRFITDIEEGKYDRNFRFKQRNIPLKIKGKSSKARFNAF